MKNSAITSSLDAVREAAKAHATKLASAAIQPAPAPLAPAQAPKPAAKEPTPRLQQFNVRLSSAAKARLQAAAKGCFMSDQEFLERFAMSLPAPAPATVPKMPWEQH